jgi:signal transduction histidine kinase
VQIYQRHLQEEELLYRFRRVLFMGSIYARDFFLDTRSDGKATFLTQLGQLRREAGEILDELDRIPGSRGKRVQLRSKVEDFWNSITPVAAWDDATKKARAFDFVQEEIVPRRNAAGDLVRELNQANQEFLQSNQVEFATSRRAAARRLLVIVGLCLLLGGVVVYFSLAYSENLEQKSARHYREVERARAQLRQLSVRLLEVQEEERRRLSRELHDEIGQALTALRIEISYALPEMRSGEAQERLQRARALAERTVQTVRNISQLLRPPMLDDLGLGPALQWQAEDFTRRTGVPCTVSEAGLRDDLPDAAKTCVYRVAQEALHNCETHASAARVSLEARQFEDHLEIIILDDGRGFELDAEGKPRGSSGLGILGMHERAVQLGGTLDIESASGRGARVRLTLPVAAAQAEPLSSGRLVGEAFV